MNQTKPLRSAGSRRATVFALLFALSFVAFTSVASAQAKKAKIDELKAAFLHQFARFVEWPESKFEGAAGILKIGVVDNESVAAALTKIAKGKAVAGHPVEVRAMKSTDDFSACHIVYLDASAERSMTEMLKKLKGSSTLTVSDAKTFTKKGGMIRVFERQSKLGIEINLDASDDARLKISSRLLDLADVVHNGVVSGD